MHNSLSTLTVLNDRHHSLIRAPKLVGLVHAPINRYHNKVVNIIEEFIHSPLSYSTLRATYRGKEKNYSSIYILYYTYIPIPVPIRVGYGSYYCVISFASYSSLIISAR